MQPGGRCGLGYLGALPAFDGREGELTHLIAGRRQRLDRGRFTQSGHKESFTIENLREDVQEAVGGQRLRRIGKQIPQRQELNRIGVAGLEPVANRFVLILV